MTSSPVASAAATVHTGRKRSRPPPGDATGWAAFAIGTAAWTWHAVVVLRAYFVQDDFLYLHDAAHTALTPAYLGQNYHGNVMPGQFLLVWLVDRIDPLNHTVAVLPVLALAAVAMALMWSCLVGLCGRRPGLLVPFTVFALAPALFLPTTWWAYSLELTPLVTVTLAAARAQLRFVGTGAARHAVFGLIWTTVGLLCWDKAVLVPIVVLGVTVLRAPGAVRRYWPLWLAYGVVLGGYLAVYVASTGPSTSAPVGEVPALAGTMVGRTFLPELLGGPWSAPAGAPTGWAVDSPVALAVTWALTVTVIAVGVRVNHGRAVLAFAVLGGYVAAEVALVAVGRLAAFGPLIGGDPRFTADAVPVALLCLTVALLPERPVAVRAGTAVLGVALAASAVATITGPPGRPTSTVARGYVTTALAAVRANPGLVLYDGGVPADVMVGWFGPSARASVVLSSVSAFDLPTDDLRILDATGTPRHVVLLDTVVAGRGPVPGCGYAVSGVATDIPLTGGRPVVRIGYYAAATAPGTVRVGDRRMDVRFTAGVHDLYVVAGRSAGDVRITSGGTVCVTDVVAGVPVPGR